AFSDCMKTDAGRRDFTMNALYADAAGTVFDPISGLDDLRCGRVRFIGDAGLRIAEDGLRILRFFRMSALYGADGGDKLDAAGLAACGANGAALARLSQERISTEFRLLLSAPNPAPAILAMEDAGLLTRIITGCRADFITRFIDLETAVGARVDWIFRLAILGGQGVAEGESALRLSNAEKKSYTGVLLAGKALDSGIKDSALGYYYGADIARAAVMYHVVQLGQNLDKTVLEQIDFGANQQNKYPIKAADLMAFAEGRELGDLLKKGEHIWVQSDFTKTKEAVLLEIND
ncbi:MAG: CCA tRNA nucleotidyltransferase, partial [Proteobacteria bacterium]|nr:CCA tRNA nucleotidyltransferase [Pseudomonadota bacterium]